MAEPGNATAPTYNNAGYESYYQQDQFWTGQPQLGYGLPPLTNLGNTSTSALNQPLPTYGMPDSLQSVYYNMPAYYMPSMTAATSYSNPATVASATATPYLNPITTPDAEAQQQLHEFYMPHQTVPVPVSQTMMGTPSYATPVSMANQISPSTIGRYDYMGYEGAGPATGAAGSATTAAGLGVRTSSTGQLPLIAAAIASTVPAANGTAASSESKQKRGIKKPKIEAPLSIRSHGDSEFDENDEEDPDRRKLNNIRERVRVRDINNAFQELGGMVSQFDNNVVTLEKTQTKLGILHNAVELIKNLEEQVKRRNLARNMPGGGPPKQFPSC